MKKYILTFEDLQNIIHELIRFLANKTREYMNSEKQIMFSDRIRWIDEFLKEMLLEVPMDTLLDELEDELKKIPAYSAKLSLDEIKERMRKEHPNAQKEQEAIRAYMKILEE